MKSNTKEIIKQLEKYKKAIQKKTEKTIKELTEYGADVMQGNLDNAQYSGSLKSSVKAKSKNTKGEVSLMGKDAGFIEFGTGQVHPDDHPQAGEFGAVRGGYGKGHGKEMSWIFTDTQSGTAEYYGTAKWGVLFETEGNPANRVVYDTGKKLEEVATEKAKEVFKK